MSLFGNRLEYVSSKVWDANKSNFLFHEIDDADYKIPDLSQKPNVDIAFSGGGTKSASTTIGQLNNYSL